MTSSKPIKLVICGGGNGAHAWAGIASSQPDTDVCVLSLFQDEAERWSNSLKEHDFTVNLYSKGECYKKLKTKPRLVTKKPEEVIPGCDFIAFVMPAFAHEQYLNAIKPYVEAGMIIVGLPGQSGFEFQVRGILGQISSQITIFNFESLPWATRIVEFGKSSNVIGTKSSLIGAVQKSQVQTPENPCSVIQRLLGEHPVLNVKGHLIGASLMSINGYVHLSILYDCWSNWDGQPIDGPPAPFYLSINNSSAQLMSDMSDEVVAIGEAVAEQSPETDMSQVQHIHDWYKRCYDKDIVDKTTLYTCIKTNNAYKGLNQPMVKTEKGKFVPDFKYRYFTEDIPYGIIVMRGIAEVVGVATPHIDKVITWVQKVINKEYLVDGKIQGKDVKETRAPQRYGYTTLKELLGQQTQ
ncbi:tauropine dehydrogenase-like isoform X1 [Actinia tenebrosa]|uniref:Tauropine dehydrogenase-like isoform X1 n=1 Tax=Actinia tenebrosa TaxID=6105 RepID=A0A6P8I3M2_ACTTE|nr:tauropine dehydrogenase-like isoform X1 [Actinia tenebrosa]